MDFKKPTVIISILIIVVFLFVVIQANANTKKNKNHAPCKNGDGSMMDDGQNSYDQNGNVVGCHDGTWGVPN